MRAAGVREPAVTDRWVLTLPAGTRLITMNDRLHHMKLYSLNQELKETTGWLARAAKMPRGLELVYIRYYVRRPDMRRLDPSNWMLTAKGCVDGLVECGVLPDDNSKRVIGPDPRRSKGQEGFVLVVRSVSPDEALRL